MPEPNGFHHIGHDHDRCVEDAVAEAARLCASRGARLTALRRRVLELVWLSHKPVGAYELLDLLRRERTVAGPPTVYRALDFLIEQGLVHRVEYLNAFIGCSDPGLPHSGQFLVCAACGRALELTDSAIDQAIAAAAHAVGFEVSRRTVEAEGRCPECRAAQDREAAHG